MSNEHDHEHDDDPTIEIDVAIVRRAIDPDPTVVVPRPVGLASERASSPAEPGGASVSSQAELARKRVRAAAFLPRVYGPRAVRSEPPQASQQITPGGVPAEHPRAQLPSLARRDRRRRALTLCGYVAAVCVSAIGLWIIVSYALNG